jgi:hypothetical protein
MRDLRSFLRLSLLLLTYLSLLAGCHSNPKDRLPRGDLLALRAIYDTSSGAFHSSQLDIHVLRGGTVNIQIHGNLTPKPDVEGDVWIPVLLLSKLPAYFHVSQADATVPITVEAYQFKGGLWCIAAVVAERPHLLDAATSLNSDASPRSGPPRFEAQSTRKLAEPEYRSPAAAAAPQPVTVPLDFQIGLASPEYTEGLPFSIPSDPSGESTSISIELPSGASFSNDTSAVGAKMVRGWQSGELADSSRASQSVSTQSLTRIFEPSSTGSKRAATLNLADTVAWDFSKIGFNQPWYFSQFRSWFLPASATLILLACLCWLRFYQFAPAFSGIVELKSILSHEAQQLEDWLEGSSRIDTVEGQGPLEAWEFFQAELRQSLTMICTNLYRRSLSSSSLEMLDRLEEELRQFEKRAVQFPEEARPRRKEFGPAFLSARVNAVRKTTKLLAKQYKQYRLATVVLWCLGFCVLVALLALLATFAKAQSRTPRPSNQQLSLPILCDLDVTMAPHDLTKIGEKFDVHVRFSPLTGDSRQSDTLIRFGTGSGHSITIDPVAPPANTKMSIVQQSETLITLKVPMYYSPLVRRINAISQWTELIKVPDGYAKTLDTANHLNFTYTLQGAVKPHLVSNFGRHWLYLFPFDSADLEIPLDMEQAALLSHLGLAKPTNDYFADVIIEGAPMALTESDNGDHYDFANADASSRLPISAHHGLILHARFQRTQLQRWGLTAGVAILAILVGIAGAWFTLLPDKDWKGYLYTLLGIGVLVFGVRATVLATYKDLPTLMTGQGTTVFEIVYIGCIVLMVLVLVIMRRILKP